MNLPFKSSKSEKPGLDPVRVEILLCKLLLYVHSCPKDIVSNYCSI